jgi:hypothetical protein
MRHPRSDSYLYRSPPAYCEMRSRRGNFGRRLECPGIDFPACFSFQCFSPRNSVCLAMVAVLLRCVVLHAAIAGAGCTVDGVP